VTFQIEDRQGNKITEPRTLMHLVVINMIATVNTDNQQEVT
jgi:LPS-assembly lipoprotein